MQWLNENKRLRLDVQEADDLIGWTGYDKGPNGAWEMGSMGVGQSSWALLEIAMWLLDVTPHPVAQADGPTDGSAT